MKKQVELFILEQAEILGISQLYSTGKYIKGMQTEHDTRGIQLCPCWLGLFESIDLGRSGMVDLQEYKQSLLKGEMV